MAGFQRGLENRTRQWNLALHRPRRRGGVDCRQPRSSGISDRMRLARPVATAMILTGLVVSLPQNASAASAAKSGTTSAEWSQLGDNAGHASYQADETSLSPTTAASISQQWSSWPVIPAEPDDVDPVVSGELAFIGYGWPSSGSGVALSAVRVSDGRTLWSKAGSFSTPVLFQSTLVVGNDSGVVYAFDQDSGRLQWSTDVFSEPPGSSGGLTLQLTAWHNEIAVTCDGNSTYCTDVVLLNARTGGQLWSAPAPAGQIIGSAESQGILTVDSWQGSDNMGTVEGLDAATGALEWSSSFSQWSGNGITISDSSVYIDGVIALTSLNLQTGAMQWQNSYDPTLRAHAGFD
jgi:outer membrane protein assembly factor BamB